MPDSQPTRLPDRRGTVEAVGRILDVMDERGLRSVTVSKLLEHFEHDARS